MRIRSSLVKTGHRKPAMARAEQRLEARRDAAEWFRQRMLDMHLKNALKQAVQGAKSGDTGDLAP